MNRCALFLIALVCLLMACGPGGGEQQAADTPAAVTIQTPAAADPGPTSAATGTVSPELAAIPPTAPEQAEPEPTAEPTSIPTPTATSLPPEQPVTGITLALVAAGLEKPTFLGHAFDDRLFVVEQPGRIRIIRDGALVDEPFLDIADRVGSQSLEQGLLSVAFHPAYAENGLFYVNYTDRAGDTVLAAYQVGNEDPDRAHADSEQILLTVNQPYANHNGGQLQFGPDGFLYVGMGDGGSAGDPGNNGQNRNTLLGALLRLDVDNGQPYGIPADNPYADGQQGKPEIWATGLRNPWRFSFDRQTGDLYLADVGQDMWEEVNFTPAGSPGALDYGWRVMEGFHCYESNNCDSSAMVLPVAEYPHQEGCSVSGGYVYRGSDYPALRGNYFYGDYCLGTIWSLFRLNDGSWRSTQVSKSGLVISSFGEDAAGELYVLNHQLGEVYRILP